MGVIFQFFMMATIRHVGFSKVKNLNFRSHSEAKYASSYQISRRSVEPFQRYVRFSIFQDGGRRHLGFWKFQLFNGWDAQEGRTASACQILSKSPKLITYDDITHLYNDITYEDITHLYNDITYDNITHLYNDVTYDDITHLYNDITYDSCRQPVPGPWVLLEPVTEWSLWSQMQYEGQRIQTQSDQWYNVVMLQRQQNAHLLASVEVWLTDILQWIFVPFLILMLRHRHTTCWHVVLMWQRRQTHQYSNSKSNPPISTGSGIG